MKVTRLKDKLETSQKIFSYEQKLSMSSVSLMACIAACGTAELPKLTEEGAGIVAFYIQLCFFLQNQNH